MDFRGLISHTNQQTLGSPYVCYVVESGAEKACQIHVVLTPPNLNILFGFSLKFKISNNKKDMVFNKYLVFLYIDKNRNPT